MKNKDFYNASGCPDPTAYIALRNVQREEVAHLVKALKTLIEKRGYVLLNRIKLKDPDSGRVFK